MHPKEKEKEWMAWSTYIKENKLAIHKDITPELIIEELNVEWQVGTYKFCKDDLAKVVKHFKIRKKKTLPPQNREIQVFELGENNYAFVMQNKTNNVSAELVTAIKKSTQNNKIKLNRIKENLYVEKKYPILEYWKNLKSFVSFHYNMDLTNAFKEEMSTSSGNRILILPIDGLTKEIIKKLETTIKGTTDE